MFTAGGEEMLYLPPLTRPLAMERRWNGNSVEMAPSCPRCASPNTKFCYFNNYSLSQPRYFCKGCRRYWTKGGSLRNVPVGGGCRKTRRSKPGRAPPPNFSATSDDSASHATTQQLQQTDCSITSGADIDLAAVFARYLNQKPAGSETVVPDSMSTPLLAENQNQTFNNFDSDFLQLKEPLRVCQLGENESQPLQGFESSGGDEFMTRETNLWTPEFAPPVPDFGFQFQANNFQPFQQMEIFPSANPIAADNWSSFDPSGYEVFLRP